MHEDGGPRRPKWLGQNALEWVTLVGVIVFLGVGLYALVDYLEWRKFREEHHCVEQDLQPSYGEQWLCDDGRVYVR